MSKIKLISMILLFCINLYAKENQALQIIAKNIESKGNIINASGDVLIFSPNYYASAKKVIYNKANKTLELFGNVNISKNNETISLSNYAFVDMEKEFKTASPVLLIDRKSEVWIDANNITKRKDLHLIKNAILSSCDCINPAWSLGFASGDYNTTKQWFNTYNNTLYIKDIPAWYFLIPLSPFMSTQNLVISYLLVNSPYVGFSTNTKRRSGLIKPQFGYSKSQGYLYDQPIFYAPALNYDFEYIPKIKSKRGSGHELKYRYKDSINSQLDITTGMFTERDDYFLEEKLINKKHYGWNLDYQKTKLFSQNTSNDGLNIDLQDMNDIEYKNTKHKQDNIASDKIIKSEISYYYNTDQYYFDTKVQKFTDIYTGDDSKVFQIAPQIQVHKYSNKLLKFNQFSSSFDFKFKNKTRISGISAQIAEFFVPVNYSKYLINNYINISFTEQLKFKNIDYKYTNKYTNAYNFTNKHIIAISSDLLKPYDSYIHTFNINSTFTKIDTINKSDDLYGINSNDNELSSFTNSKSLDNINLELNQNFYSKSTLKNIVNHRINQIIVDDNKSNILGNLENELNVYIQNASISNNFLYNHDDKMIIKSTYALKYKKDSLFGDIDYSYIIDKNTTTNSYKNEKPNKSITVQMGDRVLKYYTIKYKEQYDITNNIIKLKEYSLNINKKCWEFDLRLIDTLIASATTDQRAKRQDVIYAIITLKPLITLKQKYIQDERKE
jgi:LPS-assembly protein